MIGVRPVALKERCARLAQMSIHDALALAAVATDGEP